MRLATGIFPILVFGSACEPSQVPRMIAERDSAGVRIIEVPDGVEPMAMPALRSIPFLVEPPEFGDVLDVALGPGGRLFVLDPLAVAVVVLDSTGAELSRFGGEGGGPGEFRPAGLTELVVLGNTVAVPDMISQRVTFFDLDGAVLRSIGVPVDAGLALDWRRNADGQLLFRRMSDPPRLEAVNDSGSSPYVVADLEHLALPMPRGPLAPLPVWCVSPEGDLAVGRTDRYGVRVSENGVTKAVVRETDAGVPTPLSETDIETLKALLEESVTRRAGGSADPEFVRDLLERVVLPETGPRLAGLKCPGRGEVWLQFSLPVARMGLDALRVGSSSATASPLWDVVDFRAGTVRRVAMPEGSQLTRVTPEVAVGFVTDRLGRKRVARWRRN